MNYNDVLALVVICGGMDNQGKFINDINVLDLKTLAWCKITLTGKYFAPRCSHTAAMVETRLYIFGGYGFDGFTSSDLQILELGSLYFI